MLRLSQVPKSGTAHYMKRGPDQIRQRSNNHQIILNVEENAGRRVVWGVMWRCVTFSSLRDRVAIFTRKHRKRFPGEEIVLMKGLVQKIRGGISSPPQEFVAGPMEAGTLHDAQHCLLHRPTPESGPGGALRHRGCSDHQRRRRPSAAIAGFPHGENSVPRPCGITKRRLPLIVLKRRPCIWP